ncbi:MAG: chalcone isomerase family protein, partial [Desulfovibrio sp.]
MFRIPVSILTALLALVLLLPAAQAAERAGVNMPESTEVEGTPLVLNGLALRSVFVFDVYVAGLYLPEKNNDAEAILKFDAPRRMVMHIVRDVGRDDLNKGW